MLANNSDIQTFIKHHELDNVTELFSQAISKAKSGDLTIHPYGFYIVKLHMNQSKQVRMHVWLDSLRTRQKPDWPPHNHNFKIHSLIIFGTLYHHYWEIEGSSTAKQVLYEVSYSADRSKLTKTILTNNCSKIDTKEYHVGDSYYLARYKFHSVDVDLNKSALTLCVMTNPLDASQHVVGNVDDKEQYTFIRRNVTGVEQNAVIQKLTEIQSELVI